MIIEVNDGFFVSGDVFTFDYELGVKITIMNDGVAPINLTYSSLPEGFKPLGNWPSTLEPDSTVSIWVDRVVDFPGTFTAELLVNDFLIRLSSTITGDYTPYTNINVLSRKFGKYNIRHWADLNGTNDPNEIYGVVWQACYDASRILDSLLANGYYTVPFTGEIPALIQHLASIKAFHMLYTVRGNFSEASDRTVKRYMEEYMQLLGRINTGKINLEGAATFNTNYNSPFVP